MTNKNPPGRISAHKDNPDLVVGAPKMNSTMEESESGKARKQRSKDLKMVAREKDQDEVGQKI